MVYLLYKRETQNIQFKNNLEQKHKINTSMGVVKVAKVVLFV
jgi:hypothetical protein